MENHKPYEEIRKRKCDFIVRYNFFSIQEGGRKTGTPKQGYRSDFMYIEDVELKKAWMIWPEFLDTQNNVILDQTLRVESSGKAQMWIINDDFNEFHKSRIKIGLKAYFVEGLSKTAECEVIEIVGLAK